MGRVGVSEYQVFQVAEQLAAEGVNPSIDIVRSELGTGSRTTLNKYLKAWRERRGRHDQVDSRLDGPLLKLLSDQSQIILTALKAAADAAFQAERQNYELIIQDQTDKLLRHESEGRDSRQQLDTVREALTGHEQELRQTHAHLTDSREENQRLRESLAKEVGRRETLDRALVERDQQLSAFRKDLKTLQARSELLAESLAGKTAELQQLQQSEREHRTVSREKSSEIRRLNQLLKNAQQKQEKELGRLTQSFDKLARNQPDKKVSATRTRSAGMKR
jgi:chromosome segregation ATPase